MPEQSSYYAKNKLRVCIDEKEVAIKGRAYSVLQKEAICFQDILNFLIQMDKFFDHIGYPQSFQEKRSFREERSENLFCPDPQSYLSGEEIMKQYGAVATFDITVVSRKNTTWQGEVRTLEGRLLGKFYEAIKIGDLLEENM